MQDVPQDGPRSDSTPDQSESAADVQTPEDLGRKPTAPEDVPGLVGSDSARTAKYRGLQAWYLERQLGIAEPGEGPQGQPVSSMLPRAAVEQQPDLNFLSARAYNHALERIAQVPAEKGSLAPDRLRRNMLSSMPLCFNIFGALREVPAFTDLLGNAFGCSIAKLDKVVCEWAPGPLLQDRSAFDAAVAYTDSNGRRCLLGIETKYIEPFSQQPYDRPSYREVHESCGWFSSDCDALIDKSTNQLFRTLLLGAAAEATDQFDEVRVGVLTLAGDRTAADVAATLGRALHDPSRLMHRTYESLVEAATKQGDPTLATWARHFSTRYLDPDRPDRQPDVDGPRFRGA